MMQDGPRYLRQVPGVFYGKRLTLLRLQNVRVPIPSLDVIETQHDSA